MLYRSPRKPRHSHKHSTYIRISKDQRHRRQIALLLFLKYVLSLRLENFRGYIYSLSYVIPHYQKRSYYTTSFYFHFIFITCYLFLFFFICLVPSHYFIIYTLCVFLPVILLECWFSTMWHNLLGAQYNLNVSTWDFVTNGLVSILFLLRLCRSTL